MSKLLVSVRNATEARIAADAGVDLIDVKEPARGALGAADAHVWNEVVDALCGTVPVSVALGELLDLAEPLAPQSLAGIQFAKCGFANCANVPGCFDTWNEMVEEFPSHVSPVAVIYADWQNAAAPSPDEILAHTARAAAVLIDTYAKDGNHLFDALSDVELSAIVAKCRDREQTVVLAGSLRGQLVERALQLQPDFVAVRGAVCQGDRSAEMGRDLVSKFVNQIQLFNTQTT